MKYLYVIFSLLILSPIFIQSSEAYLTIPPTRAFSMFNGTTGNVTANSYADFAEFVAGTGITLAFDYTLHEIMINASSSSSTIASIHDIGNVTHSGCAVGQYLSVNATGFFDCTTLSGSGEANTASSSGHGESLVLAKVGVDLPFKGIACGSLMTCSSNATDVILTGVGDGVGVNSLNFTTASDFDFSFGGNASSVVLNGQVFEFRLKNNIVLTNESAQTVTKSLTLNSLTLGGAANAGSFNINSLGVPGLAADAQRVDRLVLGSSLVTSVCANGDYLSYQTSNSTWICTALAAPSALKIFNQTSAYDVFVTGINNVTGVITTNQFSVNTQTCTGTDKISSIDNVTGNVICSTDSTGSGFSNITPLYTTADATIIASNSSNSGVFKNLKAGTGITLTNNTGDVTIATTSGAFKNKLLDGSNHTDTTAQDPSRGSLITGSGAATSTWDELVVGSGGSFLYTNGTDASWKTFQVWNQSVTANTFITGINNVTGVITTQAFSSSGITMVGNVADTTNSTLIMDNSTVSGKVLLKTISGGTGIKVINGSQNIIIQPDTSASGNGAITTLASNVTAGNVLTSGVNNRTHVLVFSIPLTASKGNTVHAVMGSVTNVTGIAVQYGTNVTQSTTKGYCHINMPLTATTDELDNILLASTGVTTDTAATTWLPAIEIPQYIQIDCSMVTGATAGNLQIWVKPEAVASTKAQVKALESSFYIKTP